MAISRNTLREIVLQILYIYYIKNQQNSLQDIKEDVLTKYELSEENQHFIDIYTNGILDISEYIDNILIALADKQDLDIMSVIDRCVMYLAIFELKNSYKFDIPPAVSVYEAVNLAKKFGKDNSGSFINAVLRNYLSKYPVIPLTDV